MRNPVSRVLSVLLLAGCAAIGIARSGQAQAQEQPQPPGVQQAQGDPPTRVARLNYLHGSVSLEPAGENEWVAAVANRPLTTGDSLWVDAGARAELHIGSTAIRLGENTGVTLVEVADRAVQFRIAQGSVIINARHVDEGDIIEADSPNLAFGLLGPGEYRVDVNAEGTETATSVLRGQGQVSGGGREYTVVAGQQARFAGVDSLDYQIAPISAPDSLANWSLDRDRREDRANTANYVSPEMTGYEDLDQHGQWSNVAGYGPVWTPVGVPAGWAPYRYGHWVWIAPWGWTWVDDQPWGFAPFHYGRWAYVGAGWVWVPGPVVRPVYAPALVAFVGGGPGGGFALAVGGGPGVAWFPLGPGEVFVPAYRVSQVYVTNVNVTNTRVETTRVTSVYNYYSATGGEQRVTQVTYVNQVAPGGVTAVTRETFVGARPVAANVVQVNAAEMARAPVTRVAPVAPVRGSVMGAGAPTATAPPAAVQNRMVVSRAPAAPTPASTQRSPAFNARPGQAPTPTPAAGAVPPPIRVPAPAAQPAPRTLEMQGTPPPAPRTQEAVTPQPAPRPSALPAPAVPPKSSQEEEQKYQKPQQQQQQQQPKPNTSSSSGSKSGNKPADKDKDKDKPAKP
ncbi:MAG TPA: DUF6600 domain-containing protein [Candidatus Acidoferrales bacterium]|nr:DUF6600 domain-containing protein [Candidatus Acidoferrales bacterium]